MHRLRFDASLMGIPSEAGCSGHNSLYNMTVFVKCSSDVSNNSITQISVLSAGYDSWRAGRIKRLVLRGCKF